MYAHLAAEMDWGDLAAHALRWHLPQRAPDRLQQQCRLAQTLVAACPDLVGGLLEAWLQPVPTVRTILESVFMAKKPSSQILTVAAFHQFGW